MKLLVALVVLSSLYFSLPHLKPLLLEALLNRKVEQLTDDMKELVPSVDPELPVEFPAPEVENNVAGEVALPSL
tara:strand:- start:48 stop:269 length:222 start_codon:yes stop_codon:yes gene_type:complete